MLAISKYGTTLGPCCAADMRHLVPYGGKSAVLYPHELWLYIQAQTRWCRTSKTFCRRRRQGASLRDASQKQAFSCTYCVKLIFDGDTPNPTTNIVDFGGLDSSVILI